jgi:hypothetical protein
MAELSPKEGWKTCKNWIKSWFCNGFFYSIWTRNKRLSSLFWRYLSHLLVDFDAKYNFRKVISCRLHDWNLDLKFAKFCVKVGLQSRNLLKKVGSVTTLSWITLKFNVFCWDKYYFSESSGCKLMENYDELKIISLFFIWNCKTVKRSSTFDMPRNKLHSHTQFSTDLCKKCTKISEKDSILWIQAVLVDLKFYADVYL